MINISELRNLAKIEYAKESDQYIKDYENLTKQLLILQSSYNVINRTARARDVQKEMDKILSLQDQKISEKAAEILINPKYTSLLAEKSEQLGNDNLNSRLMTGIQFFGLFSDMWYILTKVESDKAEALNKFAVAFDIVLDSIVSTNGDNILDIIYFNDGFKANGLSFAEALSHKEQVLGKDKTLKLLNSFIEDDKVMTGLPMNQKAKYLSSMFASRDENYGVTRLDYDVKRKIKQEV